MKINALLEEMEGELTPEIEAALEINKENLERKFDGYCKAIAIYNSDVEAFDAEIKRLQARKKTAQNAIDRMEQALLNAMTTMELEKVKAGTFTVGTRKSTSVEILDENAIPSAYKTEVTTVKVDKNAIKNAIKAGETVDGATLLEKKNLSIR